MLIMQVLLVAAVLLTGRELMFTWLCLVILGRVSGHIGPSVCGDTAAWCNPVTDWDRTGVFSVGVTPGMSQDCAGSVPTVSISRHCLGGLHLGCMI